MLFEKRTQKGDGLLRNIRNLGRKATCPKATQPLFDGENHAPCSNFSGPGTQIEKRLQRGDKPVNYTDSIAMNHDISYMTIGNKMREGIIDKTQAGAMTRQADMTMVEGLRRALKGKGSFYNKAEQKLTKQIIQSKMKLEDVGVLDKTKFVGKGETSKPQQKLRKLATQMTSTKTKKQSIPLKQLCDEIITKNF